MNRVLPPSCLNTVLPFPSSAKNISEACSKDGTVEGKISSDGKYIWMWSGPLLEVLTCRGKSNKNPAREERVAACNFASGPDDTRSYIISVQEYSNTCYLQADAGLKLLLVAQVMSSTMLCLFDVRSSKVIRCMKLPTQATSVEVISSTGGATSENLALCHELRYMFGLVALGMVDGTVYLIDLTLDEQSTFFSSEDNPSELFFMSELTSDLIYKREAALRNKRHLCIQINERTTLKNFCSNNVYVSGLKYFHELASLAIGYSNGCFQIWNGKTMQIDYTFSTDSNEYEPIPIVKFLYQEPENDPKNFCYLWAVRSQFVSQTSRCSDVASALLFSITYRKKKWLHNYGIIFEDFQSCIPRFEHVFTCDPYNAEDSNTVASRMISCYTLSGNSTYDPSYRYSDDSLRDEEGMGQEFGRCVFLWEAFPNNMSADTKFYFAIFDINQWYPAQMPQSIRLSRVELCSYYGVFSLDDIMKQIGPEMILDIQIDVKSIQKFSNSSVDEMHFYPSSLSFDACCLTDSTVVKLSYLGLQAKLLHGMQKSGPKSLLDPGDLSSLCSAVGLNPREQDRSSPVAQTMSYQREYLLTLALENNLTGFLINCAQQWATTDYTHSGGTLRFLMDWAWKKVASIKKIIDTLCVPLFNCSGLQLDTISLKQLYSNLSYLKHLALIFGTLRKLPLPCTEQGLREIESRLAATDLIRSYLQVILWCHQVGLLPDNIEGEEFGENEIAFPASVFDKMYASRRQEIKGISNTVQETDLLLIDGYIQHLDDGISTLWEKERCGISAPSGHTSRLYPPPSIHAMLGIYLVSGVSLQTKNDLFLYMLLDLAEHLAYKYSHIVERLMEFPAAFNMEASHVSLIQAFWLLDHRMFEDAMIRLLNPGISLTNMLPWQHTRIIKSMLYLGESKKALKYCQVRRPALISGEDIKLYLTVLLDNGLVVDAFNFQRSVRDERNFEDFLLHFFLGCHQTKNTGKLLQLPLSTLEEELLLKYLADCSDLFSQELLVMYYLQKGRILEAFTLNEELKRTILTEDARSKERAKTRNAIVEGYVSILPNIQRKIMLGLSDMKLTNHDTNRKEVSRPEPLSTVVKPSKVNMTSQATIIASVMDKISEASNKPSQSDPIFTPFKARKLKGSLVNSQNLPFLCTPATPKKETEVHKIPTIVYPEYTGVKEFDDIQDSLIAVSPQKRARHNADISYLRTSDSTRRRSGKYLNSEFLSVLQTPTIHRQSRSSVLQPIAPDSVTRNRIPATPQSILKARTMLRRSMSPMQNLKFSLVKDVSTLSANNSQYEDEEMDQTADVDTIPCETTSEPEAAAIPKQLRFDLSGIEESEDQRAPICDHEGSEKDEDTKKIYPKEVSPLSSPRIHHSALSGIVVEDSDITINFDAYRARNSNNTETPLSNLDSKHPLLSFQPDDIDIPTSDTAVKESRRDQSTPEVTEIAENENVGTEDVCSSLTEDVRKPVTESVQKSMTEVVHRSITEDVRKSVSPKPNVSFNEEIEQNVSADLDVIKTQNVLDETTASNESVDVAADEPPPEASNVEILKAEGEHNLHLSISESDGDESAKEDLQSELMKTPDENIEDNIFEEEEMSVPAVEEPEAATTSFQRYTPVSDLSCRTSLRSASVKKTSPERKVSLTETKSRRSSSRSPSQKSKETIIDSENSLKDSVKRSPKVAQSKHIKSISKSPARKVSESPDISEENVRITRSAQRLSLSFTSKASEKKDSKGQKTLVPSKDKVKTTPVTQEKPDGRTPTFTFTAVKLAPKPPAPNPEAECADTITPVKSFIFSPPLTRSRTRKRLSSQSNVSSNNNSLLFLDSFTTISEDNGSLEVRMDTTRPNVETESSKPASVKKPVTRSRKKKETEEEVSTLHTSNQSLINFSSPSLESDIKPPKRLRKKAAPMKSRYLIRTRRSVRLN